MIIKSLKAQISAGEAAVMFANPLGRLRQDYAEPRDNAFHQLSPPVTDEAEELVVAVAAG